jgi:hypothetical protein
MPGLLNEFAERTRVVSITASSAIEGVIVADANRAQRIIDRGSSDFRNDVPLMHQRDYVTQ